MNLANQLIYALLLAAPVACIVWTVTQEEIFRELREKLADYQRRARSLWQRKIAYLPTCPYCFSHYVAAIFVGMFQFTMLTEDWRGYVVSLFAIVLIANFYLTAYNLLRVVLRRNRAMADQAEATLRRARRPGSPVETGPTTHWPSPALHYPRQAGRQGADVGLGPNGQDRPTGHHKFSVQDSPPPDRPLGKPPR